MDQKCSINFCYAFEIVKLAKTKRFTIIPAIATVPKVSNRIYIRSYVRILGA